MTVARWRCSRRTLLAAPAVAAMTAPQAPAMPAAAQEPALPALEVDPAPGARTSPRLFMQFMEPLGTTDPSVEAGWDFVADHWREDFLDVVRDLAPGAVRWGGILTSYWRWREGIGPPAARPPMLNLLWGGMQTNRIGVHEILVFCEAVGAEPLIGVNFAADGRPEFLDPPRGASRAGTPEEAAALVRYCNDPDHPERQANGRREPWGVRLWQIGNETSYPPPGRRFERAQSAELFLAFAAQMRAADPGIELIGWGDREDGDTGDWWADELLRRAGDRVDLVALHMMQQYPRREDTLLMGQRYRQDYDRAWAELGEILGRVERKLVEAEEVVRHHGSAARLAITEGHLSLQPHNKSPLLREWLAGLYHARVLNLYQRHAEMVEVATLADFFGTTWTVNAVILGSPRERPYLLPVGHIARLYRRHGGDRLLRARCDEPYLDVAASRRGSRMFLHVVNTDLHATHRAALRVAGQETAGGTAWTIDPGTIAAFVDGTEPELLRPRSTAIPAGPAVDWTFPAASVTALELELGHG